MYSTLNTSDSMILGSPVSANTSAHQPQFLPGYLLGDTSFGASSTPQRLWSPVVATGGHSPPKQHNSSRLLTSQAPYSGYLLLSPQLDSSRTARELSHRVKEKTAAPPVTGLFDHVTSPVPTQNLSTSFQPRINLDTSHHHTPLQIPGSGRQEYDTSYDFLSLRQTSGRQDIPQSGLFNPNTSNLMVTTERHAQSSPTQIDPFYTQGESIRPDDRLDDTWVTVFGFSAAATSFILQQFSQYGNIIHHVIAPEGNWMHLQYQSKIQAKKALSKNGKIFGNGIMVGVQLCIDKRLMESKREAGIINVSVPPGGGPSTSLMGTPVQQIGAHDTPTRTNQSLSMRPLTSAYRIASSGNDVLNRTQTPQKSSSMFSKALEYMFGW